MSAWNPDGKVEQYSGNSLQDSIGNNNKKHHYQHGIQVAKCDRTEKPSGNTTEDEIVCSQSSQMAPSNKMYANKYEIRTLKAV